MACIGCEVLPELSKHAGQLLLAPPLEHTYIKLRERLRAADLRCEERDDGPLAVVVGAGELDALLARLAEVLSAPELANTKSVFIPEHTRIDLRVLGAVVPLAQLVALARSRWLAESIRDGRLTSHFQPIVYTNDPTRVYAHECLLRGRAVDGGCIAPGTLFAAARAGGLLFHLDRAARLTAIGEAARRGLSTSVFINFMPSAIYDPAFCLRTTIDAARRTGWSPERFVFEVVETEQVRDNRDLVAILVEYRKAGFRVALDDLGAGYSSLELLQKLQPDFVKIDVELIRDIDCTPSKQTIVANLLRMARELGIASVGEGIETRAEWQWLRTLGADYLQGFYFARPGNPPPLPRIPEPSADTD